MPLLPIPQRRQRKKCRQKIRCHRKRHHGHERSRISPLRILHFFRYARKLLVTRVKPQPQRQPCTENGLCCHFSAATTHSAPTTASTETSSIVETTPTAWILRIFT